ncbi:hypothetical protein SAMN04488136_14813 [Vibrio xiamenensis]|uniref:UPF0231 protein SAMN04488136_1155 n=1 Tax=Vibrio xiamenensis TaxID=861298 RepID=A0A1G8C1H2_9VIBR|nr:YacL family protein [Vibrio xiamenensis]SDH39302.1 hypothetical protein SAMN04488136_1155 [Vibrio xiamenensis]SDI03958.1 hypothetical protein SAMN04488136_14813 [Vibrio xiamenensis]
MDYEFKKNTLDGSYYCAFSMGHEVLGRWLQEEINKDRVKLNEVFDLIEKAKRAPGQSFCLIGTEISLFILHDEVEIKQNAMDGNDDELIDEDFSIYESESISLCGLHDFELMLNEWHRFVFG